MKTYIAEGKTFATYKKAEEYATSKGMRVSNTERKGNLFFLELHSDEEWERYEADLKHHEEYMKAREPEDKDSPEYQEWLMAYSCGAPNKPGYFRANND